MVEGSRGPCSAVMHYRDLMRLGRFHQDIAVFLIVYFHWVVYSGKKFELNGLDQCICSVSQPPIKWMVPIMEMKYWWHLLSCSSTKCTIVPLVHGGTFFHWSLKSLYRLWFAEKFVSLIALIGNFLAAIIVKLEMPNGNDEFFLLKTFCSMGSSLRIESDRKGHLTIQTWTFWAAIYFEKTIFLAVCTNFAIRVCVCVYWVRSQRANDNTYLNILSCFLFWKDDLLGSALIFQGM